MMEALGWRRCQGDLVRGKKTDISCRINEAANAQGVWWREVSFNVGKDGGSCAEIELYNSGNIFASGGKFGRYSEDAISMVLSNWVILSAKFRYACRRIRYAAFQSNLSGSKTGAHTNYLSATRLTRAPPLGDLHLVS